MEEKKTKKKPKLIYILIFTFALVLLLTGIFDIKAHAEEYEYSVHVYCESIVYKNDEEDSRSNSNETDLVSSSPIYLYFQNELVPITGDFSVQSYAISQSPIVGSPNGYKEFIDAKGVTWYCVWDLSLGGGIATSYSKTFQWFQTGAEEVHYLNRLYTYDEFVQAFTDGTLDLVIDYDSLPIDDEMPVIRELKRNYIINNYSAPGEDGITLPADTYEYIVWSNTSDLCIQLETIPVVQYYKTLFGKSEFVEQYIGEWSEFEILESGTNKYLRQTDELTLLNNYSSDYMFMSACLAERPKNVFTETVYFFYGYRLRYVDLESGKVGPWSVVMPTQSVNESEMYQEYSDGTISNSVNTSGEISDTNYGDIDKNLEEIEQITDFKDKYETVDNEADVQEVSNWLKTVANFISGTPAVVGSVLGFLPQPILYGLYITIFLGVIASAFAIIRALI